MIARLILFAAAGALFGAAGVLYKTPVYNPTPIQPQAPTDTREQWAADLLTRLGNVSPTPATIAMVVAWQGGENTQAEYNPLATTQPAPGDTCFNYLSGRCGVRNYPDYETGMRATVETITNGYYPNILAGLQSNRPEQALNDAELAMWGTGLGNVLANLRVQASAPVGSKSPVTAAMEVSAGFDATGDVWCFQVGCQHWGTDLIGFEGEPVYAPFDLTIITLGEYPPGPTWGEYVQGTFPDGYVFYAGHLQARPGFQVGDVLPAGTLLGYTNAYNHTHIQLGPPGVTGPCAQDGTCVDFMQYWQEH